MTATATSTVASRDVPFHLISSPLLSSHPSTPTHPLRHRMSSAPPLFSPTHASACPSLTAAPLCSSPAGGSEREEEKRGREGRGREGRGGEGRGGDGKCWSVLHFSLPHRLCASQCDSELSLHLLICLPPCLPVCSPFFAPARMTLLLGPPGAGKSTLLRALARRPDHSGVAVRGAQGALPLSK